MAGNAISIIIQAQDQASQTFKVVASSLEAMKSGSTGAAQGFTEIAKRIAAMAGAAYSIDYVTTKIRELGVSVVETAGKFEKMKVQLDTLTGGQGGSKLEELNTWAKAMPINTEAAVQAFIKLKAMGLDPTLKQMTVLVDTTSALGGSTELFNRIVLAMGQIQTKGKASGEELRQLAEAGIPAYEILQKKLGLTASQVADIGNQGVSSKKTLAALFEGLAERFGGQSERMLSTWDGIMEALKSEWVDFEREVAKQGLFDFAKAQAQDLLKTIQQATASGELQKLAKDTAEALIAVGQLAAGFVKTAAAVAQFTRENREALAVIVLIGGAVKMYAAVEAAVLALTTAQKSLAVAAAATSAAMGGSSAAQATAALAAMEVNATRAAAAMTALKSAIGIGAVAAVAYEIYQLVTAIGKLNVYEADAAAQVQRVNKARADEIVWLTKANQAMGANFKTLDELNGALARGELSQKQMDAAARALNRTTAEQARAAKEAKQQIDAQTESLANLEKIAKTFKDVNFSQALLKDAKEARTALDLLRTDPFASQRDRTDGIKAFLDKIAELKQKAPELSKELDKLIPPDLTAKANEAAAALAKLGIKPTADLVKGLQDAINQLATLRKSGQASGQELADAYEAAIKKILELAKTRPEALKKIEIPAELKGMGLEEFLEKIRAKTKDFTVPTDVKVDEGKLEKELQRIRDGQNIAFRAKIDGQDLKKEADKATEKPIEQKVEPKVDEAKKAEADALLDQFRQKPSTHTVQPEVTEAKAAIEDLKKPTESTHTVHIKKVEENAVGGLIQGYDSGGRVFQRLASPHIQQGGGTEDDVPAMLMRNEFVVRKSAVEKYGTGFLYAINAGQIPVELIPHFAVGGLVNIDPNAYVAQLTRNLNFDQMSGNANAYLARIMRTFSGVRPQVFDVNAGPPKINASLSNASASLQQQRALIEEEYGKRIQLAKEQGNSALQGIWEQELNALRAIIDELLQQIQELKEVYEEAAQAAEEERNRKRDEANASSSSKIAGYQAQLSPLQQKMLEYGEMPRAVGLQTAIAVGGGSPKKLLRTQYAKAHPRLQGQILGTAGENAAALQSQIQQLYINIAEEQAGLKAQLREIEETFQETRRELDSGVKRDVKKAFSDALKEGQKEKTSDEKDLRDTFYEYLKEIQDTEIEEKKTIADLVREAAQMNISGFSHWLASGGLVGFADGGFVSGGVPGKDSVPAMLMPGEVVLQKSAVDSLGLDYALWLNSLGDGINRNFSRVLRFADGGEVPGASALRSLPAAPAGENLGTINFQIGGGSFPAKMSGEVARELRKEISRAKRGLVS